MIQFGDIIYYIDLAAFDKVIYLNTDPNENITLKETHTNVDSEGDIISVNTIETSSPRGKEIDGPKYELLRTFIETLVDYHDEVDTSLGTQRVLEKTPLSFQIAFNTLLKYGILKGK